MAAETGFLINNTLYEIPTLDSLDGDECVILFDYCGLVQEDFVPLEGETEDETSDRNQKQMKHPGFWLALMHIAYRRKHRELKDQKIRQLIGSVNRMEALSTLGEPDSEGDDVPPASTSEQPESSRSGSLVNESSNVQPPVNGGDGSTNGSDDPARIPAATGTIR